MSEFVPTTEEVRRCYGDIHCSDLNAGSLESHECPEEAEFDRWLTEYTRVKQAEAWERGHAAFEQAWESDHSFPYDYATDNPYREEEER